MIAFLCIAFLLNAIVAIIVEVNLPERIKNTVLFLQFNLGVIISALIIILSKSNV